MHALFKGVSELPVQFPTKFQLIINLKIAGATVRHIVDPFARLGDRDQEGLTFQVASAAVHHHQGRFRRKSRRYG